VLVELSNGEEVIRYLTDQNGKFLFESLRPGKWHLKVYDNNLPPYYYLETGEEDITLNSGQTMELVIKVLPLARKIKFIDNGVIQPNNKK